MFTKEAKNEGDPTVLLNGDQFRLETFDTVEKQDANTLSTMFIKAINE